jgi:hypothetical protein
MRKSFFRPRHTLPLLAACAALALAGLAQAGAVELRYIDADKFTDAGHGRSLEEVEAGLTRHLQQLGQAQLPVSRTLAIDITDIDLAGEVRPWHRLWPDTRVMRGRADWPRISLRYTLREGDRVVSEGKEDLADMAYLERSQWHGIEQGSALGYERRMLSDWFHQRFGSAP